MSDSIRNTIADFVIGESAKFFYFHQSCKQRFIIFISQRELKKSD